MPSLTRLPLPPSESGLSAALLSGPFAPKSAPHPHTSYESGLLLSELPIHSPQQQHDPHFSLERKEIPWHYTTELLFSASLTCLCGRHVA